MVPGTTIRFVLLVALLLVATATMTGDATAILTGTPESTICFFAAGLDPADADSIASYAQQSRFIEAYEACDATYNASQPPWWAGLAWTALLLAGSAVVFWAIPRWRSRRGRVVELNKVDDNDAIRGAIEEAAATAGLTPPECVVVDPAARSTNAVVFGRTGRPRMRLHGGLIASRQSDPAGFRAVLLHEFAHIGNGDVTLTYATVAMWRVFLGLVLLPYVALLVIRFPGAPWGPAVPGSVPSVFRSLLQAVVMVALVYLARSDVLRSRELHADRTARRWGANFERWVGGTAHTGGTVRRVLRAFTELWHTHPRWEVRRAAWSDQAVLFAVPMLPILLAGIAGTLINVRLAEVIADAGVPQTTATQVAAMVAAGLVTGVAGVVLWRAVVYAVAKGTPVPPGIRAGAWLGVGLAVAELVTNRTAVTRWFPAHPEGLLVLIPVAAVFAWWVAGCAHLYLSAWAGRTVRAVMAVALVPAGVVLAAWLVWWRESGALLARGWPIWRLLARDPDFAAEAAARPVDAFVIDATALLLASVAGSVLALPAVALLWLTPLLAWLIRPRIRVAQWMHAIHAEAAASRESLPPLLRVLRFAAIGGVACWIAAAATMAYLHTWQPPRGARSGFYVWAYTAWILVALAAALIVITTVAAGVATSRHRLPIALITAGAGALIGLGGTFVLAASNGCVPALNTLTSSCHWLPAPAWELVRLWILPVLLFTVIAAVIGAVLGPAVRVLVRTSVRVDAPAQSRLLARRLGVGVLCGAAVAVTVAGMPPSPPGPSAQQVPTAWERFGAPAQPPAAPRTRAFQVIAWAQVGGWELIERLADELDQMSAAYQVAAADDRVERSDFEPICTRIAEIAIDAERFFPIPDAAAQTQWEMLIGNTKKGGQDCVTSLERDDINLFLASAEDLIDAGETIGPVLDRMNAVLREGGVQLGDLQ